MTELPASRNFAADYAANHDADFENLIRRKLYVDKTAFLEDLMHRAKVLQILRPRGFGKTLSMNMLTSFLEINYQRPEDRSRPERLFKDLAVFKNQPFCDKYMGRFPVIMISLKSVQGKDFPEAMKAMLRVLGALHSKFAFLSDSSRQNPSVAAALRRRTEICCSDSRDLTEQNNMSAAVIIAKTALHFLSEMLHTQYDRRAFIIVDGYDDPLEAATKNGYYDKMLNVIAGMLETALKTNYHLENGFVTGKLHISFQSIYSGFNNYVETSITNNSYAEFMGFTKDETAALLKTLGMENRLQDVMEWYGGYNFAGNEMVCPESVTKFLSRALNAKPEPAAFRPESFRANSGINDILEILMKSPRWDSLERLQHLLEGKTAEIALRDFTSYPNITSKTDFDTGAALLLHMGYLTVAREAVPSDKYRTAVKIPNKEVLKLFSDKADAIFSAGNPEWLAKAMTLRDALLNGDADQAQDIMNAMLRSFISARELGSKAFYREFMTRALGVTTRAEMKLAFSDEGDKECFDLVIRDDSVSSAVIMKGSISESSRASARSRECTKALQQIEESNCSELKEGYDAVRKLGIVFFKKICVIMEKSQLDKAAE